MSSPSDGALIASSSGDPHLQLIGIGLENIRSFGGLHCLSLDPRMTVVIGKNNTGKTTLAHAAARVMRALNDSGEPSVNDQLARLGAERWYAGLRFRCPMEDIQRHFCPDMDPRALAEEFRPLWSRARFEHWRPDATGSVEFEIALGDLYPGLFVRLIGADDATLTFHDGSLSSPDGPIARNVEGPLGYCLHRLTLALRHTSLLVWGYGSLADGRLWPEHPRFPLDDSTEAIQAAIMCLKMQHDTEYELLKDSLLSAFPEFKDLRFKDRGKQEYLPCLQLRNADNDLAVERVHFGAGTWALLAILTAARMAKATGSRALILDEPHIYLHPGLERKLIHYLTAPERWNNKPLQLIVLSHSPAFVDHCLPAGGVRLLQWRDNNHTTVEIVNLSRTLPPIAASASELVYADRVIFVEGPSDEAALTVISRRLNLSYTPRFVALRETDRYLRRDFLSILPLVSRGGTSGLSLRPILALDADKQAAAQKHWERLSRDERPDLSMTCVFLGHHANDLESCLCSFEFLQHYFNSRLGRYGIACQSTHLQAIRAGVDLARSCDGRKEAKGSSIVARLHEEILADEDDSRGKTDYLVPMVDFLVERWEEPFTSPVRESLGELICALEGRS